MYTTSVSDHLFFFPFADTACQHSGIIGHGLQLYNQHLGGHRMAQSLCSWKREISLGIRTPGRSACAQLAARGCTVFAQVAREQGLQKYS